MIVAIVFFLLFIIPFIIAPFGISQFEAPKIIIGEAGIILLFVLSLFANLFTLPKRSTVIIGILIISVSIIDVIFSSFTSRSFFGNQFRMQGAFLLWLLLLFALTSRKSTFKKIPWYIFGLLIVIEQIVIFFLPRDGSLRYVGTLGEPNALSGFVVFLWPFVFYGIKKFGKVEKISLICVLLMVCTIIILSGSRSGAVAFGIQILFIVLQRLQIGLKKAVLVCACIYLLSYSLPFFQQTTYENRVQVWQSAVNAGLTNPLFGVGFGNAESGIHTAAMKLNLPIQYSYVDSSHNIFLDWFVDGGIVGLGALLILIYLAFKKFVLESNSREIVLFMGIITVLSFNPGSIVELLAFWWIIGQGIE